MARTLSRGEKPLDWIGSSKKDFLAFPDPVKDFRGDTYRAFYTVRFKKIVYVLHAFQKKSPKGIGTAQIDIDLVTRRLKLAQQDYEAANDKPRR
jgi:phage-related protein